MPVHLFGFLTCDIALNCDPPPPPPPSITHETMTTLF